MAKRRLEYSADQIATLADYVRSQWPGTDVDGEDLSSRLIAILASVKPPPRRGFDFRFIFKGIDEDALLIRLAETFVGFAPIPIVPFTLPYASDDRFIRFATVASHPLFGSSEARRRSFFKRWLKITRRYSGKDTARAEE